MAELKTQPNDASVEAFLNGVADERKRQDCFTILELINPDIGRTVQETLHSLVDAGATPTTPTLVTTTPPPAEALHDPHQRHRYRHD